MPITKKYPLPVLLSAMEYYHRKTKRRVTIEYIPFEGWNDREEDVVKLVRLARRIPCKINIIPFHNIGFTNPEGLAARLRPTSPAGIEAFAQKLRRQHCTVFVRSSSGEDIDAACGQLAVAVPGRTKPPITKTQTTPRHPRHRTT
jgi:23S rRNA (adenine2503-C2)-methyltransferase